MYKQNVLHKSDLLYKNKGFWTAPVKLKQATAKTHKDSNKIKTLVFDAFLLLFAQRLYMSVDTAISLTHSKHCELRDIDPNGGEN